MSIKSNFYAVTNQIMLEYRSDQYEQLTPMSTAKQPTRSYIYKGLDGALYYTEDPRYTDKTSPDYYKNQSLYLKLPDEVRSKYTYMGMDANLTDIMNDQSSTLINKALWLSRQADPYADLVLPSLNLYYDTIRIYFIRGFAPNSTTGLDGISIRISTEATKKITDGDRTYKEPTQVCLLDFYLDSNDFSKAVRWMSTPVYMNSKFYDKYIEVEFPAPYAVALADNSSLISDHLFWEYDESQDAPVFWSLNQNSNISIEFATVSAENSAIRLATPITGLESRNITTLTLDPIDTVAYLPEANSNFFNAKIYEDNIENAIIYYPTYGDIDSQQELDQNIMAMIESGEIPIIANAFYDTQNTDLSINDIDFATDDLYYYDPDKKVSSKWVVYNDIVVSYLYKGNTGNECAYNESYSRMVDYKNDLNSHIQFWRTRFVPNTHIINSLSVKDIAIMYTCRLVNLMRGVEVIRIASLTVDAAKYTDNLINKLNIRQYKIYNKIGSVTPVTINQPEVVKEKYVRSYYNATNLVAKNIGTGGSTYPQGQMTLRLFKTSNNYMLQLFNLDDNNIRIPYDLTGPYKYKIVFPLPDGNKLSISPNSESGKQNLGTGTLVFYITGEQATNIMRVPDGSRYFCITTDNGGNNAQDTTLYEGLVDWIS